MHDDAIDPTGAGFGVLRACVRWHLGTASLDEVRAACARIADWQAVVRATVRHRSVPLLAAACRALPPTAVPPGVRAQVEHAHRAIAARNLALAACGRRVTQALEAAGIAPVWFKGPSLAVIAYRSLSLRMFDDLDLLVSSRVVERAWDVLAAEGFHADVALSASQRRALVALQRPVTFASARDRATIDLHVAIAPGYQPLRMGTEGIIGAAVPLDVAGRTVLTLPVELLLVLLAAHGAKHMWERLSWVTDVAAIITAHPGLDWDEVVRIAGAAHSMRTLRLACAVAAQVLNVPVPRALEAGGDADRIHRLARAAVARMTDPADHPPSALALARFHLASMDRWRDRGRYVATMLQPSEADAADTESAALTRFARYPRRLVRLARRGTAVAQKPVVSAHDR